MNSRAHKPFGAYPLRGRASLSTGAAPTPYHVYDGHGAFVGGFADFDARADSLSVCDAAYEGLGFEPQFVRHMRGFKFGYPQPR